VKGTFEEAMTLTLGLEGGWYDGSDPRDPNPTMYGVTQKTYDAFRAKRGWYLRSVRFIGLPERDAIYREYWDAIQADLFALGLPRTALCLFDMAINAGPLVARKLLQATFDLAEDGDVGDLDHDGIIGPQTREAISRVASTEDELVCLWLLMERVCYYNSLADSQRLRPNLKSWLNRTVAFYEKHIRS
jgi:lysozyme family protein